MTCCDTLSEKNNQLKIDISKLMNREFDLECEVERLREQVRDLEYEVERWQGELQSRMHPIDYDALVNGGEEE